MSIKVIIADDEEKICQLILHLVDWKSLGMEVVAVEHNGLDALEAIRKHLPDVVITDIRMPGYNGLELIQESKKLLPHMEFVIISGYRHFEYAQSAIRYGVKDYLLKPIKKEELNNTLQRMRDEYRRRTERLSQEEMFRITLQNNMDRMRAGFFTEVLFQKKMEKEALQTEWINAQYHYSFQPGCFQMAVVKIDGVDSKSVPNRKFIQEKVLEAFNSRMREYCYDFEICLENYTCYAILNYREENRKTIRHVMKQILDYTLLQNDIFENLRITVGSGSVENSIAGIRSSLKIAKLASEERLIRGTNRVLEYEKDSRFPFADSGAFHAFNQRFTGALANLDERAAAEAIAELEGNMLQMPEVTGHEILQMAKEAMQVFLFTSRQNHYPLFVEENFFEDYVYAIDGMSSAQDIFAYTRKLVGDMFHQLVQTKLAEDNRPIRMAKQYIRQNYGSPITLESVSEEVGFNPSYFSTLFKRETGVTFSEYLRQIRMETAKELLKETKLNVADICEKVGYSDQKHFTKMFAQETGLKPNQYRKLYS